jgi:hypothetical protein
LQIDTGVEYDEDTMKIKKVETNFTQVSNNPLNDKRLSWKAKGVFAYLYSKPDSWDFSSARMKNDSKDGRDALLSGLKELEEVGYLIRKKLPSGRVEYILDYNPVPENPIQASEPVPENPTVGKSHSGKSRPVSNTELNSNTEEIKNTESDPVYKDSRFIVFWNLYPKKTGKGDAWKSWLKLKMTASLSEQILESVRQHIQCRQWKSDDGRYIPNPSTFLNQRRFDDEVEQGAPDKKEVTNKYKTLA